MAISIQRTDREYDKFEEDSAGNTAVRTLLTGAIPGKFDDVDLTYTGDNLTGVVYKLNTVTIRTLTLTYDGSDRLCRVQVS